MKIKKEFIIIGIVLLGFIIYQFVRPNDVIAIEEEKLAVEEKGLNYVYVDIKGEVELPGVYKLEDTLRIYEAIKLAGGITTNASVNGINLSSLVEDGSIIVIPNLEDKSHNFININLATVEMLITLPKLGESRAKGIIQYREENGYFKNKEEIMNVTGIGESIYNEIKDFITS